MPPSTSSQSTLVPLLLTDIFLIWDDDWVPAFLDDSPARNDHRNSVDQCSVENGLHAGNANSLNDGEMEEGEIRDNNHDVGSKIDVSCEAQKLPPSADALTPEINSDLNILDGLAQEDVGSGCGPVFKGPGIDSGPMCQAEDMGSVEIRPRKRPRSFIEDNAMRAAPLCIDNLSLGGSAMQSLAPDLNFPPLIFSSKQNRRMRSSLVNTASDDGLGCAAPKFPDGVFRFGSPATSNSLGNDPMAGDQVEDPIQSVILEWKKHLASI
ncbi:hypothetical protein R6Q59_032865 [Mikania micrantha]